MRPFSFATTLIIASLTTSIRVRAEETPSPVSENIDVISQFVFRGLTQTSRRVALQGGADYTSAGGFYLGTWLSNVSWFHDMNPRVTSHVEWDMYAGFKGRFPEEFGYDVGVLQYTFPGHYPTLPAGTVRPDTTEPYFGLTWRWVSLKYAWTVGNAFGVAQSIGSHYTDFRVVVPLRVDLTLELHVGRQDIQGVNEFTARLHATNGSLYSYTDSSVNFTYTFSTNWNISVAHTDTNARDDGYLAQGRNIGAAQTIIGVTHLFL